MNSKLGANADTPKFVARYIENFIDLVENVPNDLSRRITRVHELQLDYESSLSKLESNLTRFSKPAASTTTTTTTSSTTSTSQADPAGSSSSLTNNHNHSSGSSNNSDVKQLKLLLATQHCLVRMQEISDHKLAIIQDALDQLDGKSRELDHDFKLINAITSDGLEPAGNSTASGGHTGAANNSSGAQNSSSNHQNSGHATSGSHNSKGAKNNINNKHHASSSSSHAASASHHQPKSSQRESPEPTYCVCHQVSYGDMICCDNDACDIEWFHFQCVSLTSKPKGKWYCPNCRGDRSNQPKK